MAPGAPLEETGLRAQQWHCDVTAGKRAEAITLGAGPVTRLQRAQIITARHATLFPDAVAALAAAPVASAAPEPDATARRVRAGTVPPMPHPHRYARRQAQQAAQQNLTSRRYATRPVIVDAHHLGRPCPWLLFGAAGHQRRDLILWTTPAHQGDLNLAETLYLRARPTAGGLVVVDDPDLLNPRDRGLADELVALLAGPLAEEGTIQRLLHGATRYTGQHLAKNAEGRSVRFDLAHLAFLDAVYTEAHPTVRTAALAAWESAAIGHEVPDGAGLLAAARTATS